MGLVNKGNILFSNTKNEPITIRFGGVTSHPQGSKSKNLNTEYSTEGKRMGLRGKVCGMEG